MLSLTSSPSSDSLPVLKKFAKERNPVDGVWHFSSLGDNGSNSPFVKGLFSGLKGGPDLDHFVLVDDSLRVRKYYLGTNKDSVDLLIRHLSMVMPKEKKKEIVYDPEKEK